MIKYAIILFILTTSLHAQCSAGCLACGTNSTCAYCDGASGYYLSGSTCAASNKTNCVLLSQANACLACQAPAFYLDANTLGCVAVPTNGTIANCAVHSAPSVCSTCQTGYYKANSTSCATVTTQISNCLTSDTLTTCSACNNGFALNTTKTECVAVVVPPNCALSTQVSCIQCKSGFSLATAAGLSGLQPSVFSPSFATSIAQVVNRTIGYSTIALPVCYSTDNCLTYDQTDFTCAQCKSGFSYNATSKTCFQNPLPRVVDFCDVYQSATTCAKCIAGYLLASASSCVPLTLLANCNTYNLTAPTSQCLTCTNSTYLTPLGNCITRTRYNLPNCVNYTITDDTCASCEAGYMLTTDSRACLPLISSCLSYAISAGSDPYFVCNKCAPGTFRSNAGQLCSQGTVLNCETYATSVNVCATCANGFRLDGSQCVAVTVISFCNLYSRILDRKCEQCVANSAKFTVQNGCSPVIPIPNCKSYSTTTPCSVCNDGYQSAGNGASCAQVTVANCAKFSGPACVQCNVGFIYNSGQCVSSAALDLANCDTNVVLGTYSTDTTTGCRRCNSQSAPFDRINSLYCTPTTVVSTANSPTNLDTNCLAWRLSNSVYVCIRCKPNWFIASGACVGTCPNDNPQKYSFFLTTMASAGKYSYSENSITNNCGVASSVANCDWVTPQVSQASTTPAYGCAKCATNFLPFVALTAPSILKETAATWSDVTPGLASCSALSTVILGVTPGQALDKCAYYIDYPTYNKKACLGCQFGFTGVVRTEIINCIAYSSTDCLQCKKNFHVITAKSGCEADVTIAGCLFYNAQAIGTTFCLSCTLATYFRTVAPGTCTARTYTDVNCGTYHENLDQCIVCINSKILVSGKCYDPKTNCKNYGPLASTPFYECVSCDHAVSYLKAGSCVVGTVANCIEYSQAGTDNKCLGCAANFELSRTVCIAAADLTNANTNGVCQAKTGQACTTCYKTALPFAITKMCKQQTTIANCLVNASATTCLTCSTTFYLQNPTTCTAIPAGLNCDVYAPFDLNNDGQFTALDYPDSTTAFEFTCEACKTGYYYSNTTVKAITFATAAKNIYPATCVAAVTNPVENCATNGMNSLGTSSIKDVHCSGGCTTGNSPYSFDGLRVCVSTLAGGLFSGTTPYIKITNCYVYKKESASGDYKCIECVYGFGYDSSTNTCVTTCSSSGFIAKYELTRDGTNDRYMISKRFTCVTPNQTPALPTNCQYIIPSFTLGYNTAPATNYVCAQCKTGFVPISSLNPTTNFIAGSPPVNRFGPVNPSATGDSTPSSTLTPFNEIKACVATAVLTTALAAVDVLITAIDPNCESYGMFYDGTVNTYTCNRCVDGFVGKLKKKVVGTSTTTYMYKCTQDNIQFKTNFGFTGFNLGTEILTKYGSIRSIFSVYECTTAGQSVVAFLGLNRADPSNLLGWTHWTIKTGTDPDAEKTLATWSTKNVDNSDAETIKCIDLTATAETNKYLSTNQVGAANVVANCGLYILNTNANVKEAAGDVINPNTATTKALICVACSPGYKPTYTGFGTLNTISACATIVNCPTLKGNQFNVCGTCPFARTNTMTIDYGTCAQTTVIANCFLSDNVDATKCALCKPGFILDKTKASCVTPTTVAKCDKWELQSSVDAALANDVAKTMLPYSTDALIPFFSFIYRGGCSRCVTDFQLVEANHAWDSNLLPEVCVPDSLNVIDTTVAPFGVADCSVYSWTNDANGKDFVICTACGNSKLLTSASATTNSCVTVDTTGSPKHVNCLYYSATTSKCLTCKTDVPYLNINGLCTAYGAAQLTAKNCVAWDFAAYKATPTSLLCKQCANLYYPVAGVCTLISTISGAIANCAVVSGTTCTVCIRGYVLVKSVTDVLSCQAIVTTPGAASVTPHDAQCLTLLGSAWDNFNLECFECSANWYSDTTITGITNWCYEVPSYKAVTNCVEFVAPQATYGKTLATCTRCASNALQFLNAAACTVRTAAAVTNCLHKTETADTCMTCDAGFTFASNTCTAVAAAYVNVGFTPFATEVLKLFLPNVKGYMESCATAVADCTVDQFKGLVAPLAPLFSCHRCTTVGNIPFAFVHAGDINQPFGQINGLFSYGTNATANPMAYYDDGLAVRCLNPVVASFHSSFTGKFAFPTNCALGIVNVWANFDASMSATAINVDKTKIGIMCVACAPKFKATGATDTTATAIPSMVSSCTAIANCQTSLTFGQCDVCAATFTFQVDANSNIDRTSCYQINTATAGTNCQLINAAGLCVLCTDGYYFNLDGVCEKMYSPNCDTTGGNPLPKTQTPFSAINVIDSLFYQPYKGCLTCTAGFTPTLTTSSSLICINSDNINSRPTSTKYTPNCQNYFRSINGQSQVTCDVCRPGFVITTVNTCITTTDAGCKVAISALACSICINPAHLFINGVCTNPSIPNCATYSFTVLTTVTCAECGPGFVLQNNACVVGTITNCAKYSNPTTCYQCLPDFVVKRSAAGVTTCVQSPITLNCAVLDDSVYNQYGFNCLVCNSGYYRSIMPLNYDFCFAFAAIDGCVTYDVGSRVSLATQQCTACNATTYLNTQTSACVARTATSLTNCLVVNPTADICLTPIPSVTATTTTTSTTPISPQPAGIPNCQVYDAFLNCLQCSSTTYYNGTRCLPVATANAIPNCLIYNSIQVCIRCNSGYINRVGLCIGILGTNCDKIDPVRGDCITCLRGYGLFESNGFNNCIKLNDTNCDNWTTTQPYRCTGCLPGFGLNAGQCSVLNTTVANCAKHSADNVCVLCNSGYTLNATNPIATTCLQTSALTIQGYTDSNCDTFNYFPTGICYLCTAKFTLINGTCVACAASTGCLICDNTNTSKCLICAAGYFTNGTGVCYSNIATLRTDNNSGTSNSTNNQTGFFPGLADRLPIGITLLVLAAITMLF